jgi:hypothetical protein
LLFRRSAVLLSQLIWQLWKFLVQWFMFSLLIRSAVLALLVVSCFVIIILCSAVLWFCISLLC